MTTTDGLSMTEEELEQVRLRTIAENSGNPDGEVPDDGQVDYFEPYGGKQRDTVTLPDGHSWIEFKIFNEGERKEFLNKTNRDMTITGRGKASMRARPGDEKHVLLTMAITGWNLVRGADRTPVPFNPRMLGEWLIKAPTNVVDVVEKAIRKANPWTLSEMSVADIDKEMADLQELREAKLREEAGKDD